MRRSRRFLRLGSLLFLLSASWFVFGPAWSPANKDQQAPAASLPKVTISRPVVREIIEWDEYTGRLEATESVEVRARVNGYLQSIHFKDGAIVKKGDLLFVIDPRPYQAELDRVTAELQLAQARLELAKSDYARAQKLLQFRAISQEEADTRAGVTTQKRSPDLLMVVHLLSPDNRYDQTYIGNYALLNVRDALVPLEGVGDITVLGLREYSMRVWLDPERLASLNLTAANVTQALRAKPSGADGSETSMMKKVIEQLGLEE